MKPVGERGEDWFTSLYAAHYPDIVRYGLRRLPDVDAAAELAQAVRRRAIAREFVRGVRAHASVPGHDWCCARRRAAASRL